MIEIRDLTKSYVGTTAPALENVTLSIERGSFFTLLGPSGCGKTTLLRCIAGLETPDAGEIRIDGTVVFSLKAGIDVPVNRRRVGMVFQSYAIWPHMSVFENVAFPVVSQKRGDVRKRVMQALDAVELAALADRPATRLSGGQQQRVALARAIVTEPATLLLDEPLSNLDAGLREQMRAEMRRLQQRLDLTTVLVTHDQEEALSLSDQIALLRGGRVIEEGTPRDLYARPKSVFAAEFIGAANLIKCTVEERENGLTPVSCAFGRLWSTQLASAGSAVAVVRPERIKVGSRLDFEAAVGRLNAFPGRVTNRKFLGGSIDLDVEVRSADPIVTLRSRLRDKDVDDTCAVTIDPSDVRIVMC